MQPVLVARVGVVGVLRMIATAIEDDYLRWQDFRQIGPHRRAFSQRRDRADARGRCARLRL